MATHKLLLLPGDGIGPEVMAEVRKIIDWFGRNGLAFAVEEDLVGGCAYDAHGAAVSDATMERALAADAVLSGLGLAAGSALPPPAPQGLVRLYRVLSDRLPLH